MHPIDNPKNRYAAHPLCVAWCEIVVCRNHVDPSPLLRIPDDCRNRRQVLPPGLHLDDPIGECQGSLELRVEHHESQLSLGSNSRYGDRSPKIIDPFCGLAQAIVTRLHQFCSSEVDLANFFFRGNRLRIKEQNSFRVTMKFCTSSIPNCGVECNVANRVPGSGRLRTEPVRIVISQSRDLAYEYSKFTFEFDRKDGVHVSFTAGLLRVWQKQDVEWKQAAVFARPYDN